MKLESEVQRKEPPIQGRYNELLAGVAKESAPPRGTPGVAVGVAVGV